MSEIAKHNEGRLPRVRPATDILEREDGFHLFMDMPGVAKDAVMLDLKENELTVSARAEYPTPEGRNTIEMEFASGEYYRRFTLSDAVDQGRIRATMSNGVLEIYMPKKEKMTPKRIEIQAG